MSITWDLSVQRKLYQNFDGNSGGTCIYIYIYKKLPEIFQYIAKKNVEKFRAVTPSDVQMTSNSIFSIATR